MNAAAIGDTGFIDFYGRERVLACGDESDLYCLISVGYRF